MRKRQNAKQEKELDNLKETFSEYKLTNYLDLARLRISKTFPYENKPRIYREVSKSILQSFEDMQLIFHFLPLSYRTKIIADSRFHRLLTEQIFPSLKQKEQKIDKDSESTKYESYVIYQSMFTIGIEGLIRSMPTGFQNYLLNQITPLMQLMESITLFYRSTTGKKDIPHPYGIPETSNVQY